MIQIQDVSFSLLLGSCTPPNLLTLFCVALFCVGYHVNDFLFCISGKDKFPVNLHFSILLLALAVSFRSVLISSFPHTSLLPGSQHDFNLKPSPELMCKRTSVGCLEAVCNHGKLQWPWSRLAERVKLPTQYFSEDPAKIVRQLHGYHGKKVSDIWS